MSKKAINRLKVVLAKKNVSSKWLAEQLGEIELLYQDGVRMKCNLLLKHLLILQ